MSLLLELRWAIFVLNQPRALICITRATMASSVTNQSERQVEMVGEMVG